MGRNNVTKQEIQKQNEKCDGRKRIKKDYISVDPLMAVKMC